MEYIEKEMNGQVVERFLKYVSFETTSYEDVDCFPTSKLEFELAKYLRDELKTIGMEDVYLDENCYVYAHISESQGVISDAIGFMSHMDTSCAVSGKNIKPQRFVYEGGDIVLNPDITMKRDVFPFLDKYKGQELIITDGTTLLGADDKAGIAEIVTAMEYILNHPELKHGRIDVVFNPDEETGRGTEKINLERFNPAYAYTLDGGRLGELEYECFNAAHASVKVTGLNVHPGSAKGVMKNAVLILSEFISMLPESETPSHTEGYEGFYHVDDMNGNESKATASIIVRDHSREIFKKRKNFLQDVAAFLNEKYGEGTIEISISDTYYNMRDKIEGRMEIVNRAKRAFMELGIEPIVKPIRGGTDGSALTFMGIPCPNLSTGGENFHSIMEFVSVDAMKKMVDVIKKIACADGCDR